MHTLTQDLKYRVKPSKSVRALYDGANSGDCRPCPSSCAASVRSPVSPQTSIYPHPDKLEFVAFPVQEIAVFFIIESGTQTRIYPLNPRTE